MRSDYQETIQKVERVVFLFTVPTMIFTLSLLFYAIISI